MILSDDWTKLTVIDRDTGEELATITSDEVHTSRDSIVVKLTPKYKGGTNMNSTTNAMINAIAKLITEKVEDPRTVFTVDEICKITKAAAKLARADKAASLESISKMIDE